MAEKSLLWTTGATGDGASAYTQAETIRWQRQVSIADPTVEAVLKGYLNELEVTGTSSPVAINTGAANVYGFPYWNTASVNKTIATPSSNTRVDRIVLEADWAAQTIRIAVLTGTEGVGSAPAVTQTDGVTWEISLATVSITTGGVITVTDTRDYIRPNIAVDENMIDASVAGDALTGGDGTPLAVVVDDSTIEIDTDTLRVKALGIDTSHLAADSVDSDKAGDRIIQLHRRQGNSASLWTTYGATTYTPTAVIQQVGSVYYNGSGTTTVTFPVAFGNYPLVFACVRRTTIAPRYVVIGSVSASQFTFQAFDENGAQQTVDVFWLAIGPEA